MRSLGYALCILLAGCPDVVSVDDPRVIDDGSGSNGSDTESGYCTGSAVSCRDRSVAQCKSPCTITSSCHSPDLDHCATHRDPDICDSDSLCRWSTDACKPKGGIGCSLNESQTACDAETYSVCEWGNACTGLGTYCAALTTSATCLDNLGCRWTPN